MKPANVPTNGRGILRRRLAERRAQIDARKVLERAMDAARETSKPFVRPIEPYDEPSPPFIKQ